MVQNTSVSGVNAESAINVLLGIWFFVSPWVFGVYTRPNAWNAWIIGAAIVIFAGIRAANPLSLRIFSWVNMALGICVFASPWVYSYTANTGRFINSICVGIAVFVLAITSWSIQPRPVIQQ
jgi:hypothetical protein